MREIFNFYEAGEGWHATLDAYPTDAVIAPRDAPVCDKMRETAWAAAYQDKDFVLYARPGRSFVAQDDRARSFAGVFP
jgi:hypothetical protein